ncbi:hypothetical protein CALCODRAFT_493254, partial [Calocera cornea HHB12733]
MAPAPGTNGLNGHSAPTPTPTPTPTPAPAPAPDDAPKYATGMIYPPPDIRTIIDRTALHVARSQNPTQFEERVRESQRTDPKFAFLAPLDAYHPYYRLRVESIRAGEAVNADTGAAVRPSPAPGAAAGEGAGAGAGGEGEAEADAATTKKPTGRHRAAPPEPPELEFVLPTPRTSPLEVDTIKLTALFFAVRGAGFLQALSVREGQNPEFEFLRPTHPLFGYFSRLVSQYKTVLLPTGDAREKLRADAGPAGKARLLEESRARADWERWKRDREKKRAEDQEAERKAFAEIDWHDYAVVQTIEFTPADAAAELPPPMSVQDVESMTLAQKRMARMINESTTEEIKAANEAADVRNRAAVEETRAREEQGRADRAEAVAGVKRKLPEVGAADKGEDASMEDAAASLAQEEADRLRREAMAQVQLPGGQMKIRENYVPRGIQRGAKKATTTCTICGQQIPIDELEEHMRIELLDPRWKSQRDVLEQRRAQANELQFGANVASSLRTLARTRVDIFGAAEDEVARRAEEEAEKARAREREKIVWDGHTASKESTAGKFQSNVNFEEQIAAIHRSKGLGVMADSSVPSIGPALGPGITPAPAALNAPALPEYANAVVSAAPQPATAPVYGGPGASVGSFTPAPAPPAGFAPPGMHPSRLAALSATPGGSATPTPDEAATPPEAEQPPAKRQRIERYDGHTYSEADWLAMHPEPISIQVQLPNAEDNPGWHFDGKVAEVPELPLTLLVSTLRDRIVQLLDSTCPVGRIRLTFQGKTLTNAQTMASYNLEDGDMLYLSVRDMRKR